MIAWGADIDIRDAVAVNAALCAEKPDAIVHLAAIAAPSAARANPREAWDVNVMGTFNLAQAVRAHAPAARFVFVGSSESYGASFKASDKPISEDAALAPLNAYGATKAAADLMIGQMAQDGLRSVRLRPFNHTGPGQSAAYVVSDFARQVATIEKAGGEGVIRVGNLEAIRDFLDVRDVVKAYAAASLADDLENGAAINIARGAPVSIRDILDGLISLSSARIRVEVDEARLRANDIATASGNPSRAASLLGWRAEIPLKQTLVDVLGYWREAL